MRQKVYMNVWIEFDETTTKEEIEAIKSLKPFLLKAIQGNNYDVLEIEKGKED